MEFVTDDSFSSSEILRGRERLRVAGLTAKPSFGLCDKGGSAETLLGHESTRNLCHCPMLQSGSAN